MAFLLFLAQLSCWAKRSLSVNLTLEVWKSGGLDFGLLDGWKSGGLDFGPLDGWRSGGLDFGLLDHLTII